VEHHLLRNLPHPAHPRRLARPRLAAQPQDARGAVLPHGRVLPLHHLHRRDRGGVEHALLGEVRADHPGPHVAGYDRRRGGDLPDDVGDAGDHHRGHVALHGLLHAAVPRGPAGDPRRDLRSRAGGRRERHPPVLERHPSGPAPDDLLRHRDVDDREFQDPRPHPRDDRRRAGNLDDGARPVHLSKRFRGEQLRIRLGGLDRAVPHLHPLHDLPIPREQAKGKLMGTLTLERPSDAQTPLEYRPDRGRGKRRAGMALLYAALIAASAAIMLPFAWMVISSLKTNNQVFTVPIQWIPDPVVWENYLEIWKRSDMLTWVKNSLILSVGVTFLQVLTGSFAAYGFAKMRFPGRDVLFLAYVGTIAVPWQAYMIPQFILLSEIVLNDTLWAILSLQAFGAFGVFLMKQYYESIPDELSEAARIDGLSEYSIWRKIVLPLSGPAIATLTLLTF